MESPLPAALTTNNAARRTSGGRAMRLLAQSAIVAWALLPPPIAAIYANEAEYSSCAEQKCGLSYEIHKFVSSFLSPLFVSSLLNYIV
jgi:hypothetical protein